MRLHVVGLPHTSTTRAYDWCAYTAKVRRFGAILGAYGHEAILYGGPENEGDYAEFVPLVTRAEQAAWWPDWSYDDPWPGGWEPNLPWFRSMNARAIAAISERIEPGDALALIMGGSQVTIADFFQDHAVLEWGIGYKGILNRSARVFESRAWQHHVYGLCRWDHGFPRDAVIPNSFAPDELTRADPEDYLLFIGRMIAEKGLAAVTELAKHHRVVTAGQGRLRVEGAEHRGVVLGDAKAKLIAGARAVLVPTLYLEPFGGVAAEAMLSGVPVITTDWGAFPEYVLDGTDGYRCSSISEFVTAASLIENLRRDFIASRAAARFSTEATALQYDAWLRRLATPG